MSIHPNDAEAIPCETAKLTPRCVAGSREYERKVLFSFTRSHHRHDLRIDLK
jgi:hypothetical protein